MSGVLAAGVDGGLVAMLANDSGVIKQQLDTAMEQESTGKVSDVYAGLGTGLRASLDLRPAAQHLQTWSANVDSATARLDVTQTALTQISSIASSFRAQTADINTIGDSEVSVIATDAQQALGQVAQLLNTKVGNVYVFAGQDTGNPPIPNTNPAVVGADLLASDTATPPFSATLGTAVPTIQVGERQSVQVGVLANKNTLTVSAPPTTGSYMRDIMRELATLANLTPGAAAQTTAEDVQARLTSAITALSDEQGVLGNLQSGLTTTQTTLQATATALDNQVSTAEDVDSAATITKVQALQTQLQASYQLTAGIKGLSLANFLS